MGNPNPKFKMRRFHKEPMAEKPLCVRLTKSDDEYVRNLSNRTEWVREAIAEKRARDLEASVPKPSAAAH